MLDQSLYARTEVWAGMTGFGFNLLIVAPTDVSCSYISEGFGTED